MTKINIDVNSEAAKRLWNLINTTRKTSYYFDQSNIQEMYFDTRTQNFHSTQITDFPWKFFIAGKDTEGTFVKYSDEKPDGNIEERDCSNSETLSEFDALVALVTGKEEIIKETEDKPMARDISDTVKDLLAEFELPDGDKKGEAVKSWTITYDQENKRVKIYTKGTGTWEYYILGEKGKTVGIYFTDDYRIFEDFILDEYDWDRDSTSEETLTLFQELIDRLSPSTEPEIDTEIKTDNISHIVLEPFLNYKRGDFISVENLSSLEAKMIGYLVRQKAVRVLKPEDMKLLATLKNTSSLGEKLLDVKNVMSDC